MVDEIEKALTELTVSGGGSYRAALVFGGGFTGFKGHFPGNPVLPGVCQILVFSVLAERAAGRKLKLGGIPRAKFLSVIEPGERAEFRFSLAEKDGVFVLAGETSSESKGTVGKFKLVFGVRNV